jgi:hypothetical protein
MYLDNTEIGKKYKNQKGNVVTVIDIVTKNINFTVSRHTFPREVNLVLYRVGENLLVDEQETFEMLHSEIEPVYEYQYAFKENDDNQWKITNMYYTDKQAELFGFAEVQKLEFTKREVQNGIKHEEVK